MLKYTSAKLDVTVMAYNIDPNFFASRAGLFGKFPNFYDINTKRGNGIKSSREDMPESIEFYGLNAPPDVISLTSQNWALSEGLRAIFDEFASANREVHYIPLKLKFVKSNVQPIQYFFVDMVPDACRVLPDKSRYQKITYPDRHFFSLIGGDGSVVMRKSRPGDPHIWREQRHQTIEGQSYGHSELKWVVSDELWTAISENYSKCFSHYYIEEIEAAA